MLWRRLLKPFSEMISLAGLTCPMNPSQLTDKVLTAAKSLWRRTNQLA